MHPISVKRRILLAEDDPAVLKMTQLRLEHEGFEVVPATDGQQALERALEEPLDLILLDLRMPKLDGFQVCERLKMHPRCQQLPIIVFTASESHFRRILDRCLELGIVDWIKKPFYSEELLEKIHRALGLPPQQSRAA